MLVNKSFDIDNRSTIDDRVTAPNFVKIVSRLRVIGDGKVDTAWSDHKRRSRVVRFGPKTENSVVVVVVVALALA
jgi:hypothetical protein